jgi:UDP-N-acetylmuramoyl-L-alanyl-D-glutamate--2,6-diaminopimelate ligase
MTFQQVLDGVEVLLQRGNPQITGLEYDSRRVVPGQIFVAIRGESTDGNRYIDAAIARGAVAIVSDSSDQPEREQVAWARVVHARRALARMSANLHRRPAERLRTTGITGTNGKTTTSYLIESILRAAGRKCTLVGTVEYHVGDQVLPAPHTTPESLELHGLLARSVGVGVTDVVMEVSSHALAQQRIYGIPCDIAVFTNLTRDHLDFHLDFEQYFAAKCVLFDGCGTEPPRVAVVNIDDEYGRRIEPFSRKRSTRVLTYGWRSGEIHPKDVLLETRGIRMSAATTAGEIELFSPLVGHVNVYNILAAVAATVDQVGSEAVVEGIRLLRSVPGRFERVDLGQPFSVVVDYAHTDDALRNLTAIARDFVTRDGRSGRVITLFGCGGDRDRSKRPLMAKAAGQGSDFVVLTSDNPRSEDPLAIISDALVGLEQTGTKYVIEPDRRQAINIALEVARPGDIVLLAGKGHERVQVTREGAAPFNDVEVASEALVNLGYGQQTTVEPAGSGRRH